MPQSFRTQADVTLAQARICNTEKRRLIYARTILQAALHNMVYVIRQNSAKKEDPVKQIEEIKQCEEAMNEAENIQNLMLIEARARLAYYETYNKIIQRPEFAFGRRTRRPPRDPLNAIISFGNVFLYNRIATEIYKSRLDINLSVLHRPEEGRVSLALDLAEIYKPLIVDRAIFSLINRKEIHSEAHFETTDNRAVYLNHEEKESFLPN